MTAFNVQPPEPERCEDRTSYLARVDRIAKERAFAARKNATTPREIEDVWYSADEMNRRAMLMDIHPSMTAPVDLAAAAERYGRRNALILRGE